jgi:hypothetical protein
MNDELNELTLIMMLSLISRVEPYESSKWATNITAIYMNEQFRKDNVPITSVITSPGVVASNIGGLPAWVGRVRRMVHYAVSRKSIPTPTTKVSISNSLLSSSDLVV